MKTNIVFLILTISYSLAYLPSYTQDVIIFKNGDEIKVKVIEVLPDFIKYNKWDNLEGPIYTSYKSEVFMIKYQNGTKDIFNDYQEQQKPAEKTRLEPPEVASTIDNTNKTVDNINKNQWTPCSEPIIIDARDNQKYPTVQIGNQCWLQKNMNFVPDKGKSWCYDNKQSNCDVYGRLYNFYTARRVCPDGWHLPSKEEWEELVEYLKSLPDDNGVYAYSSKLREQGMSHWATSSKDASNVSGFTALPGGDGYMTGKYSNFRDLLEEANFWSRSQWEKDYSMAYEFSISLSSIGYGSGVCSVGKSVRCIKDEYGQHYKPPVTYNDNQSKPATNYRQSESSTNYQENSSCNLTYDDWFRGLALCFNDRYSRNTDQLAQGLIRKCPEHNGTLCSYIVKAAMGSIMIDIIQQLSNSNKSAASDFLNKTGAFTNWYMAQLKFALNQEQYDYYYRMVFN